MLALLALGTALFARVLTVDLGAPDLLKFAHFAVVCPLGFIFAFVRQTTESKKLVTGLMLLFIVIFVSALVNSAGLPNIVLDFLLLSEPFFFLILMVQAPWSTKNIERFRLGLFVCMLIHLAYAYRQTFLLGLDNDHIKGVFLEQGAGHHIAGALGLGAAVYFAYDWPFRFPLLRPIFCVAFASIAIFSDSKQVIGAFMIALVGIVFVNLNSFRSVLTHFCIMVFGVAIFLVAANELMPSLAIWNDFQRVQLGVPQKLSVFALLSSFFHSEANWAIGLGPGHTIGRLGWLLSDYGRILYPMGATSTQIPIIVMATQEGNYVTNSITGSSLFSLIFSWVGVWGDLGFVGLSIYLYLWWVVWKRICVDGLSRFFLIGVFVLGAVFTWMEEPAYMLFFASLIGLRFQSQHVKADDEIERMSFDRRRGRLRTT